MKKRAPGKYFVFRNTHPENIAECTLGATAVNAAAVVTGKSWDVFFRSLLEQSQNLGVLPNDFKCVREMLRVNGFIHQPSCQSKWFSAEEICTYMNEHCTSGVRALLKTPGSGTQSDMLAVLPVTENGSTSYKVVSYIDHSRWKIDEIWLCWPDGEDHSPVARRTSTRTGTKKEYKIPQDHARYSYQQENPENRIIGDCLVRGLASACGISWKEVIALFLPYRQTTINNNTLFRDVLRKQGFVYHDLYRQGEAFRSVAEFCMDANRKFQHGEYLFVCVGAHHVAAVLPFRQEDGSFRYRVVDTWDCSSRKATEYWVRPAAETDEPDKTPPLPAYAVGDRIEHPAFGTGIVRSVSGESPQIRLEIEFPGAGLKKLGIGWVTENCRRCG
ncbi:MAG: hypothetical protein II333_08360 [Clostridia bacterium]|nr:hypothetical protein [Clostridia bacterium]